MDAAQETSVARDELLRLAAASAPVILFMVDRQGVVQQSLGKSLAVMSGGRSSIGQSIYALYAGRPDLIEVFERALAGESLSLVYEAADLGMFFETHLEPLRAPDGEIIGLVGAAVDQTARLAAERARRDVDASEERFRLLVESVEEYAILMLDPQGRVSSWNSGAQAIKGYREQEILGQHLSVFYPEEARQRGAPQEALATARRNGHYEYEGWLVHKDGQRFWANVHMTPMYSPDGQLLGFARVTRDMSRRRQIEEALRASESRFRTIFEGSALGSELFDLDGRLLAYNLSIQRMFGFSAAELDQVIGSESPHPANVVANSALFGQLRSGLLESYTLERPYRHRDGNLVWGRTTVSLVRDQDQNPQFAIAMVEDITDRKQMEAEVAELQRRLMEGREAERLHLAQELHDGPIQELYGLTYQLQGFEGALPADQVAALAESRATVQQVIDTLRGISGELRPPTLAPFGLKKAIQSHAMSFQETYPGLKLQLDLMEDGQELPEDLRLAFFRIYQACLTNVLRHADASEVEVRFAYDQAQVSLEIHDDGKGFEVPTRWIQLARQGHLGLVSAHERAQAIGGQFSVESAPGQGTTVRLVAPRQNDRPSGPENY
jgi:PAS domain S-box-containing protein